MLSWKGAGRVSEAGQGAQIQEWRAGNMLPLHGLGSCLATEATACKGHKEGYLEQEDGGWGKSVDFQGGLPWARANSWRGVFEEATARWRHEWRADGSCVFSRMLNKSCWKGDLEDISAALALPENGKKDKIFDHILSHFETHPELKLDPHFEGLFNSSWSHKWAQVTQLHAATAGPSNSLITTFPSVTPSFELPHGFTPPYKFMPPYGFTPPPSFGPATTSTSTPTPQIWKQNLC